MGARYMPRETKPATETDVLQTIEAWAAKRKEMADKGEIRSPRPEEEGALSRLLEENRESIFGKLKELIEGDVLRQKFRLNDVSPELAKFFREARGNERPLFDTARGWFALFFGGHIRIEGDLAYGGLYIDLA